MSLEATEALKVQITQLVEDLYYPSESDEKIDFFEIPHPPETDDALVVLRSFLSDDEGIIEEMAVEKFFEPLLETEDWFEEQELKWVEAAQALKEALVGYLLHTKVLRVGAVEIDTYLLGKTPDGQWLGIKTVLVET